MPVRELTEAENNRRLDEAVVALSPRLTAQLSEVLSTGADYYTSGGDDEAADKLVRFAEDTAAVTSDDDIARFSSWTAQNIVSAVMDLEKVYRDEGHVESAICTRDVGVALREALAEALVEGEMLSVAGLSLEQRRELADRTVFPLDAEARREWEEMNQRPVRDLPDLREFMQRRSPYINYDESVSEADPSAD